LPQLQFDLLQERPQTLGHRLPAQRETAVTASACAAVGEAQKVERLWLALATRRPSRLREPSEFDEPRLLRMQLQAVQPQPLLQSRTQPLAIASILRTDDEVVCIANNGHHPACTPFAPSMY